MLTYVIYSGGIKNARDTLDCGTYLYKISPVFLTQKSADEVFHYLQEKSRKGESFSEEDYAKLSLTPLMSSGQSRKDTIKTAILFAKQDTRVTAEKTVAILYTMADKFLQGSDLEEIKEVVAMTRLGQMLYDDGLKAGKSEGTDRMASLTKKLLEADRMADLQLALDNPEYREKLMEEYGIK